MLEIMSLSDFKWHTVRKMNEMAVEYETAEGLYTTKMSEAVLRFKNKDSSVFLLPKMI